MPITTHLISFSTSTTDWTAEVAYDGSGFSCLWVSVLDSQQDFSGAQLDVVGCWDAGPIMDLMDCTGAWQRVRGPLCWRTLRSLALAAAEDQRSDIDWKRDRDAPAKSPDMSPPRGGSMQDGE